MVFLQKRGARFSGAIIAVSLGVGFMLLPWTGARGEEAPAKRYVGTGVCKECHDEQYENYKKYSKKAHSFGSVVRMRSKLTKEELRGCYACHTTGYGRPGGFVSEKQTPGLKDCGCESCHGPGSLHAESEDADHIKGKLSIEDCTVCHNKERVGAFRFRPLIYGGGH